jgi:hypothetical protein
VTKRNGNLQQSGKAGRQRTEDGGQRKACPATRSEA